MKYLILFITLMMLSCLDQIELGTTFEDPKVVVDGTFTSLFEKQIIKLSYSTFVENQVIEPLSGAQVYIEGSNGERIDFIEEKPGEYTVMGQAALGTTYQMKAKLLDGDMLTSRMQEVPRSFPMDSISIRDSLTVFLDANGKRKRLNAIHFYAHSDVNSLTDDLFLRYDISTAYQVTEVICSPFVPKKTCYIRDDEGPQSIQLLNLEKSNGSFSITQYLYFRAIDYPFGEVFGLDVGLLSYNLEEYLYWENLKAIFDQNGDITDILPGKLIGNMQSQNGQDILGQFAVVGKSRLSKLVRNSDFTKFQNPFCGVPGFQPFPLPDECCSCTLFPYSSLEKPDFWP